MKQKPMVWLRNPLKKRFKIWKQRLGYILSYYVFIQIIFIR